MSLRKTITILCVVLILLLLVEASFSVTIYTPEGCEVTAMQLSGTPYYTIKWAQDQIDWYSLDAEIIGDPTKAYNCHGYAWSKTEGIGDYWIQDDEELKFVDDGSYANDGQPSYLSCSQSQATHAWYEPYSDHSIRVIRNGYPVSSSGSRNQVSKWNDGPLVRHALRNDVYAAWFKEDYGYDMPIQFYKLKTTHYGTLTNYPKKWIGAGGKTHTLSENVTCPPTLTIKSNATINISDKYIKCSGSGNIVRESNVTFTPKDIILKSGSTIKGQFPTIQLAIDNSTAGQRIDLSDDLYAEYITIDKNITIEGSGSPTIRGHTEISNCSATLKYLYLEPGSSYGTALGIYNGTATSDNCFIRHGPYTGWWGIWCSSSTLKFKYGGIYTTCTASNTSVFLINAGSSTYVRDCTIKPGNGIAISGTAAGYAQNCIFITYYKDSGWDINAYFADSDTFKFINNNYGSAQEIYDPEPYNVSGDGWPPGGLARQIPQSGGTFMKPGSGDLDDLLARADSLVAAGEFDKGITLLISIINDYPETKEAVSALHKLVSYRTEQDLENNKVDYAAENQTFLSELIKKFSADHPLKRKALECEIHNEVRLGNVKQAIDKGFAFNEQYSDLECGKRVLLSIADIHRFVTNDDEAAKQVYGLFAEKYPNHPLSEYARLMSQEPSENTAENPVTASNFAIYPNPFNLATQINYRVPDNSYVTLTIYNSVGQHIRSIVNKTQPAGNYTIHWDGKNSDGSVVASGLYFCRLKINNKIYSRKILLMK